MGLRGTPTVEVSGQSRPRAPVSPGTVLARRVSARLRDPRRNRQVFALPAVALILVMGIWPLVQLIRMSLHQITAATLNGDWASASLQNYRQLLDDPDFRRVVVNTLIFVVLVTVVSLVGGFLVAVSLSSSTRGGSFLLGMMVFIWALPPVINGSIWKFLLADHGLVNELLRMTGIAPDGIGFLYDAKYSLWSVALVNAWGVVPFNALIFRASLMGIDTEVLQAAQVDGVRPSQMVRYIMLPHVRPAMTVLTVLTIVYAFRSFDFIYVMTAGGPGTASATVPYLAYVQAFVKLDYGSGAATALLALIVVLPFALIYARDVRRNEVGS